VRPAASSRLMNSRASFLTRRSHGSLDWDQAEDRVPRQFCGGDGIG
jgi:hypothetical protein